MFDIIRDSTLGQLLNRLSHGKILPYADQRPDYVVPARFLVSIAPPLPRTETDVVTLVNNDHAPNKAEVEELDKAATAKDEKLEGAVFQVAVPYPYLVDWDENDQDNPRNWSQRKRVFVAFMISLLTFSIYVGSAIYTASIPSLMEDFGVGSVTATWGLTLFVLAYGVGPMFLAPLQEMPLIGRNPVYIAGLFLFVLFQLPILVAPNFGTILVFRFAAGWVGSPALATGGASMGDLFPPEALPAAIAVWALGAVFGPITGPVIGGFAAQANGWRWPIYELLWISGFSLIVLFALLPETFEDTILLRRAERLRRLTGNPLIKTQTELDATLNETAFGLATENFILTFKLSLEPAVLVANSYIALVYAIFYLWFEAFPLVFNHIYHFNLGIGGLPYLAFIVSGAIAFIFYILYQKYHIEPRMLNDPDFAPEARLELGLVAGAFIPTSLLIFGWSAQSEVHWIVPIIGAALYLPGIFLLFQCILMYIGAGYPKHAAAILAGNDLFRSSFASVFPLFGAIFFERLGLGGGCSLLAGVSIIMIPMLYLLIRKGAALRARSKWTD